MKARLLSFLKTMRSSCESRRQDKAINIIYGYWLVLCNINFFVFSHGATEIAELIESIIP
jgi:hypothetical protein